MIRRVVVTGGSGGGGRAMIADLVEHGYEVVNLDLVRRDDVPYRRVDMTDYGQVFAAMHGWEAVVHFASNPEPDSDHLTGADRFHNNTLATFNVFQAAVALGMHKVVWASSETVFGYPFETSRPHSVPVTEDHDSIPQSGYALSKVVCEELAHRMNVLHGMPFIGLRYSNIHYTGTDHPHNYAAIPGYWGDPHIRKNNLWGYIDSRDAASIARLALESDLTTAEVFNVAAADTIMNTPSRELMAAIYPEVPVSDDLGEYESLISIDKAHRVLGWAPRHSWRSELASA